MNPFSDICIQVQEEQIWTRGRHLRRWPRAFFSRDGWIEWTITEGAW